MKKIILDTNIYGEIAKEKTPSLVLEKIETKTKDIKTPEFINYLEFKRRLFSL